MTVWKDAIEHPIPEGESVLCWDAVNTVMFVAYRSGDGLIPEPHVKGGPTPFQADWWRRLPPPPKGGSR
jgi:hypothetical protein